MKKERGQIPGSRSRTRPARFDSEAFPHVVKNRTVERYSSVIVSKAERLAQRIARGADDEAVEQSEQAGCPYCDTNEAHLHGSVLYELGRRLF